MEQFASVYNYDIGLLSSLIDSDATSLINNLVALEKPCYNGSVNFVNARVWERGGTPAENETIKIMDLTGGGTQLNPTQSLYPELAVVVQLDTGRNTTTGRKIYLRKYVHALSLNSSGSQGLGAAALTTGQKGPFLTYGQAIREVTVGGLPNTAVLESPGGQNLASGATVTVLDYLHIRQFTRRRPRRG